MSETPAFRLIVMISGDQIQIFKLEKKRWLPVERVFSLGQTPKASEIADLQGESILVVMGDQAAGHIQMALPNKKDQLTDENIGAILQKDYDIDVGNYEFALQKFLIGRDTVQVSVTGIERPAYQAMQSWVSQLSPKKVWMMPFSWFVSVLKSVEPVLIAVAMSKTELLVSHHYLGVDDARQIALADVEAYANDRKKERKETHLLYVQAVPKIVSQIQKQVGETVMVHPLLEEATDNPVLDVVTAVMQKGSETLSELLHFVVETDDLPVVEDVVEAVEEIAEEEEVEEALPTPVAPVVPVAAVAVASTSGLPAPTAPELPKPKVSEPELPAPVIPEVVQEDEEPASESVEETHQFAPAKVAAVEVVEEEVEPEPEVEEKPDLLTQLKSSKVASDNRDRYVEVKKGSSWKSFVGIAFLVALVTAVIGGAIFWSNQVPLPSVLNPSPSPSAEPTAAPTAEPTPVPTPAASATDEVKAETSILILNATGITGLAGKEKAILTAKGWKDVDTGNATGTYADAFFAMSEDEALLKAVEADYGQTLKVVDSVKEDGAEDYDVVIVIAQER